MAILQLQKKGVKLNKKLAKKHLFLLSLLIIPLVNFALFWVYINIDTIIMTFQRYEAPTASYKWYGFTRYIDVFKEFFLGQGSSGFNILLNSLRAIPINIVIFPLAFIVAYAFYKKVPGEKFFRVIFFIPSIISLVVLTMMFRQMFSSEYGPVAKLLELITGQPTKWLDTHMWGIISFFCVWAGMGSNVIVLSGAMLRIPEEIGESARLDGIGFWREAWSIVVPLVMPTVGIYLIGVVTSVFGFTLQPMLFNLSQAGADNKYMTIGWYVFANATGSENMNTTLTAATLGVTFSVLMLPFIVAVRVLVNKFTPDVSF